MSWSVLRFRRNGIRARRAFARRRSQAQGIVHTDLDRLREAAALAVGRLEAADHGGGPLLRRSVMLRAAVEVAARIAVGREHGGRIIGFLQLARAGEITGEKVRIQLQALHGLLTALEAA